MSVPQSERRQSQQEYVTILQQMEMYFLDLLTQPDHIYGITEHIFRLSTEAYNNATIYFEMTIGTVRGSLADRKKYCNKTIWAVKELAAQINILIAYRMRYNKSVQELVIKTKDLVKVTNLLIEQLTKMKNIKFNKKEEH